MDIGSKVTLIMVETGDEEEKKEEGKEEAAKEQEQRGIETFDKKWFGAVDGDTTEDTKGEEAKDGEDKSTFDKVGQAY